MEKNTPIIIIAALLIIVVGIVSYYIIMEDPHPFPSLGNVDMPPFQPRAECDATHEYRLGVIEKLEEHWEEFEQSISLRPVLGATDQPWQSPAYYQFIGNERMLIAFEDGHTIHSAAAEYECVGHTAENFSLLAEIPDGFPMEINEWKNFIKEHGNPARPITTTYTNASVFIDDEVIELDDWTELSANLFVQ